MNYWIKDTEFIEFLKFFKTIKGIHKKDFQELRKFIEAVYYICKAGCPWRMLPDFYGNWRAVHKRFKNWSDKGIWQALFEAAQKDPDMEYVMLDATIVRAHSSAAGYRKNSQEKEALGRSRGGFSTKIHALCDALGYPLKFILTGGQKSEITQADALVADISNIPVLADKGYDSDKFLETLIKKNCIPVIPPRINRLKQRKYDDFLYEDRNRIECFFGKIKHFRRFFSRFEKSAKTFLSIVHFIGALIWVR